VKDVLPDSHTDFIFAVVAEEYGLIACLILLALFAFIVLRGLSKAAQEPDGFIRHATAGLIMLFGLQALINMAVNVGLLPAKGMTLPFISYGGSSLLAMALTMGFALGLTRRRPTAGRLERSTSESGTEGTGASARGSPGGSAGTSAGTSAKEHAA
jgi:cell division protein FtsW